MTTRTYIVEMQRLDSGHGTPCPYSDNAGAFGTHLPYPVRLYLSDFVRHNSKVTAFTSSDPWVILSPIEQSIKQKIEAVGTPLKDWNIQINYGIKTGCNEAFIISTEKRDEILANCRDEDERKRTEELIRPILRGRDIRRYSYDWAGQWVICARVCEDIPKNYPTVCRYLEQFKVPGKLGDNSTTKVFQRPWWSWMQEPSYWEDFFKPKIMYSEIVREPQFFYDTVGQFIPEATTFILVGEHLEYIYRLVHSTIVTFAFKTYYAGGGLGENGYRYKKAFFEKLPIPLWSGDNLQKVIVNSPLSKDIENEVAELFKLSEEELDFITSNS